MDGSDPRGDRDDEAPKRDTRIESAGMARRERVPAAEAQERLGELVERFADSGGRGVDDAEEIDRLRVGLALCRPDEVTYTELLRTLFGSDEAVQSGIGARLLEDPDMVGESSYRALYDLMVDTFESAREDGDDPIACMVAELDSVLENAMALRDAVSTRYPIEVVAD